MANEERGCNRVIAECYITYLVIYNFWYKIHQLLLCVAYSLVDMTRDEASRWHYCCMTAMALLLY